MRTHAHLALLAAEAVRPDRAPHMPLLGLLSGLTLALLLWTAIGWLFWALFA